MNFIDASEYEEIEATAKRVRNILRAKATWDNHNVVITRVYVEKGWMSFAFKIDDIKYLLETNLTLQMGEPTHWTLSSNSRKLKRSITPEEMMESPSTW